MKYQGIVEKRDPKFKAGFIQQTMSSILGSSISTIINTPLDNIKYRMQGEKSNIQTINCFIIRKELVKYVCPGNKVKFKELHFHGITDAFLKIYKYEGIKGLYMGFFGKFFCSIPANAVYFVSYEKIRTYFNGGEFYDDTRVPIPVAVFSGTVAKILETLVVMPLEPQLPVFGVPNTKPEFSLRSVYKSLPLRLYKNIPFSAIYWPMYEYLKITFDAPDPTLTFSFCSGVFSAVIAAFITAPLDLVNTLDYYETIIPIKNKEKKPQKIKIHVFILSSLHRVYELHGISGCFAGAGPRLVKIAPAVGMSIALFEVGNNFFYDLNEKQFYATHKYERKKRYEKTKAKKKVIAKWPWGKKE